MADEHVVQLGQLVEPGPPEEGADTGDPRVLLSAPDGPRVLLRVGPHRSELVQNEDAAVLAQPGLAIQERPGRLQLDRQSREKHQGQGENQAGHRGANVEEPLDDLGARRLDETI